MKSSTASPRNSSRSLSSSACGFSFRYERCVNARDNKDKFVKDKPKRRANSAGDSGRSTSVCETTGTSVELRERQTRSPPPVEQGLAVHQFQKFCEPIVTRIERAGYNAPDILRYNHRDFPEEPWPTA